MFTKVVAGNTFNLEEILACRWIACIVFQYDCLSQRLCLIKSQSFNRLLFLKCHSIGGYTNSKHSKHFELIAPLCHNLHFVAERDYFSIEKITLKFASCYIAGTSFYRMLYWEQYCIVFAAVANITGFYKIQVWHLHKDRFNQDSKWSQIFVWIIFYVKTNDMKSTTSELMLFIKRRKSHWFNNIILQPVLFADDQEVDLLVKKKWRCYLKDAMSPVIKRCRSGKRQGPDLKPLKDNVGKVRLNISKKAKLNMATLLE